MAGTGDRFRRAGYREPKPLIVVDGRPIIEHVVRMFPEGTRFTFLCHAEHLADSPMRDALHRTAGESCTIVAIEPHTRGPVHTVLCGAEQISDADEVIVNYCDFSAYWDYAGVLDEIRRTGCQGALTAYRGFHPHSLGPNYYAYIREQNGEMLEVKEKACFTSNRMEEFASTGTYYFASGAMMKRYFRELVGLGVAVNDEYYVSMVFNLLVRDRLRVRVYEVEHFLQWGTPEDLEEYRYWSDACDRSAFASWRSASPIRRQDPVWTNVTGILPMAGTGARYRAAGYVTPKPFIDVSGQPMVSRVVRTLPAVGHWVVLCRAELQKTAQVTLADLAGSLTVVTLEEATDGQAMARRAPVCWRNRTSRVTNPF